MPPASRPWPAWPGNLDNACSGLLHGKEDLCLRAIADDEDVNGMERRIDATGLDIMTRFQPVARDLRRVLASTRVANNIERISDEAKNIARRSRLMLTTGFTGGHAVVEKLYLLALAEFTDSVQSFLTADAALATTIRPRDKELDAIYRAAVAEFSDHIAAASGNAKDYLDLLFIIRSIERVGDHSKNIAEETMFMETR